MQLLASLLALLVTSTAAFLSPSNVAVSNIQTRQNVHPTTKRYSTKTSNTEGQLNGVQEFESWFQSKTLENDTMKYVSHAKFSNGRGLEFIGSIKDVLGTEKPVIELPKEFVLKSTFVEDKQTLESMAEDWDVVLSVQLLQECQKNEESDLFGYCRLLTQGMPFEKDTVPSSTAPHCVRNWTNEQKKILGASNRGQRLLNVVDTQAKEWNDKYNALDREFSNAFTKEQFFWAMEAVNSRAFRGDFGGEDLFKKISKSLIPFAAAAFGLNVVSSGSGPFASDERLTVALLVLSCAPVVLNFVSENFGTKTLDAVLLPFIDSANHLQEARSNIQFDPVKGVFTVCMEGKNCIVEEDDDRKQFYISYGEKRDTELLLNYGFLPNMNDYLDDGETDNDEIRRVLAELFNSRSI